MPYLLPGEVLAIRILVYFLMGFRTFKMLCSSFSSFFSSVIINYFSSIFLYRVSGSTMVKPVTIYLETVNLLIRRLKSKTRKPNDIYFNTRDKYSVFLYLLSVFKELNRDQHFCEFLTRDLYLNVYMKVL